MNSVSFVASEVKYHDASDASFSTLTARACSIVVVGMMLRLRDSSGQLENIYI